MSHLLRVELHSKWQEKLYGVSGPLGSCGLIIDSSSEQGGDSFIIATTFQYVELKSTASRHELQLHESLHTAVIGHILSPPQRLFNLLLS